MPTSSGKLALDIEYTIEVLPGSFYVNARNDSHYAIPLKKFIFEIKVQ
jgi:hypothetical protein